MPLRPTTVYRTFMIACLPLLGFTAEAATPGFDTSVRPYFRTYCLECHDNANAKGGMNLEIIQRAEDFLEHPTALTHVIEQLDLGDMPPKKAKQPAPSETSATLAWLRAELARQQNAAPNDPGIVVAPRLNSSEYGNAIRDLFGTTAFDASEFLPPEGGAGEGFSNVGEAQSLTVTQFEAYLTAATRVLSHGRVTPQSGFNWSSIPQGEVSDQKELLKKLRQNWVDWMDLALAETAKAHVKELAQKTGGLTWMAYMERAWMFQNRAALGLKWTTLADAAKDGDIALYPESLAAFHTLLTGEGTNAESLAARKSSVTLGLIARINALPTTPRPAAAIRKNFQEIDTWAKSWLNSGRFSRDGSLIDTKVKNDSGQTRLGGSATYALEFSKAAAGELVITITDCGDGKDDDFLVLENGVFTLADGSKKPWQQVYPAGLPLQGRTVAWGSDASPKPVKLGPDAVSVAAPAQFRLKLPPGAKTMALSIKTHPSHPNGSMQCSFDDTPPEIFNGRMLARGVLGASRSKRAREFDDLFKQIGLITRVGEFTKARESEAFHGLAWFDAKTAAALGVKFPQPTPPGGYALRISPATLIASATPAERARIEQFERQLRELAASSAAPDPAAERAAAQKLLADLAARAWRRPLAAGELDGLVKLYDADRAAGYPYDFAVKTALKAVLVSSDFVFRFQESRNQAEPYPIAGPDLANRLAFALWASLPDNELLRAAAQGKLSDPAELSRQARRLLADPRARSLATEFAGQWLHFAGFDQHSGPDAEKFPQFTDELKKAMYEESVLFFADLLQNNRPVTHLIRADYTFVNEPLAKLYGIDGVKGPEMRRVALPAASPRGGLLGMASVLTKHSAPLRTSQVQRGVWVYEQILGVKLPDPPPNVPQLSDTETNDKGLTIAQQLAKHREDPGCASCHAKFDALGFALENFDPIGRWREKDGAGNPLETNEKLDNGRTIAGVEGLRAYLEGRRDDVARTFSRKLAGYVLGRGLLLTDKDLIEQMTAALKANQYRPLPALDVLLASRQFRYRRDEALPRAAVPLASPTPTAPLASNP